MERRDYLTGLDKPGMIGRYGYDESIPHERGITCDADGVTIELGYTPSSPTREELVMGARRKRKELGNAVQRLILSHENMLRNIREAEADMRRLVAGCNPEGCDMVADIIRVMGIEEGKL